MSKILLLKYIPEHPLAVNFPIISGEVTIIVPENATVRSDAIVVCMYRLSFGWVHFLHVSFQCSVTPEMLLQSSPSSELVPASGL
jgi:hypothetical protein